MTEFDHGQIHNSFGTEGQALPPGHLDTKEILFFSWVSRRSGAFLPRRRNAVIGHRVCWTMTCEKGLMKTVACPSLVTTTGSGLPRRAETPKIYAQRERVNLRARPKPSDRKSSPATERIRMTTPTYAIPLGMGLIRLMTSVAVVFAMKRDYSAWQSHPSLCRLVARVPLCREGDTEQPVSD